MVRSSSSWLGLKVRVGSLPLHSNCVRRISAEIGLEDEFQVYQAAGVSCSTGTSVDAEGPSPLLSSTRVPDHVFGLGKVED